MNITDAEFQAIIKLMDFVNRPVAFGCSIHIGDDATYEGRVGWLFEEPRTPSTPCMPEQSSPRTTVSLDHPF